jgi:diadenosine tetraphosphatase ApaH/serine/threonine PP2A family protein phosphatase
MRDAWMPLQRMASEIAFFGHTHLQGAFSRCNEDWAENYPVYPASSADSVDQFTLSLPAGSRHMINPGSVGQPRDADWRAAFAIYDEAAMQVIFFRTPYDVASAQAAIRAARLPERLAERLTAGR